LRIIRGAVESADIVRGGVFSSASKGIFPRDRGGFTLTLANGDFDISRVGAGKTSMW
jgi:hypothetical protein